MSSRDTFEIVKNGPYDDGWYDVTCVGAGFQEQYRRVNGFDEFRHRPIYKMFATFPSINVTEGHIGVRHGELWLAGPSPDGACRHWPSAAA